MLFLSARLHRPSTSDTITCADQTHCFPKEILHVCYLSPSVVCVCVCGFFFCFVSRVLSDLLWTGVDYAELTSRSLWTGMLVVRWSVLQDVIQQGGSNLLFFPVRLIVKTQKMPTLWVSDLKTSAVKQNVVCTNLLPVLDMIYFDKKRLKWTQCKGGFLWCLHTE